MADIYPTVKEIQSSITSIEADEKALAELRKTIRGREEKAFHCLCWALDKEITKIWKRVRKRFGYDLRRQQFISQGNAQQAHTSDRKLLYEEVKEYLTLSWRLRCIVYYYNYPNEGEEPAVSACKAYFWAARNMPASINASFIQHAPLDELQRQCLSDLAARTHLHLPLLLDPNLLPAIQDRERETGKPLLTLLPADILLALQEGPTIDELAADLTKGEPVTRVGMCKAKPGKKGAGKQQGKTLVSRVSQIIKAHSGKDTHDVLSLDAPIEQGSSATPLGVLQTASESSGIVADSHAAIHTYMEAGAVLQQLSEQDQEVLRLTYQVKTDRELAEKLGITEDAAKKRRQRAQKRAEEARNKI